MCYDILPLNHYGQYNKSILRDEDLVQQIHLQLLEKAKDGYIWALDVVDIMATPKMKRYLGTKTGISVQTAQHWLNKIKRRYGKSTKGMYIDGHEHADVVEYCTAFLKWMEEYEKQMTTYNHDGNILSQPTSINFKAGIYPLVAITQDESAFPMNEGPTIMISGMMMEKWGELKHDDRCIVVFLISDILLIEECRTSQVVFKAGKNWDGYFDNNNLIGQVELSMDIFEEKTHGFKCTLFLFSNATTHQKHTPDALSAQKMVKNPKLSWTP